MFSWMGMKAKRKKLKKGVGKNVIKGILSGKAKMDTYLLFPHFRF
jgi:hypothetical protein